MSENRDSCDCRRVTEEHYNSDASKPGDFYFLPIDPDRPHIKPEYIVIRRPDGSNGGAIPIKRGANAVSLHWGWDGDRDKPTLIPSVWWKEHWHGFLRSGRLESC